MKKYLYILILLAILAIFTGVFVIKSESYKLAKFAASYHMFEKSDAAKSFNVERPCPFSQIQLKNRTAVSCQAFAVRCDYKIPGDSLIGSKSACALLIFDINGYAKKPNVMSSTKNIQDRYKVLVYSDGITSIPESIEDEALHSEEKTLKNEFKTLYMVIMYPYN